MLRKHGLEYSHTMISAEAGRTAVVRRGFSRGGRPMRYGMVFFVLATALLGRAAHAQEGPYEVLPESVQCFPYTTCSYITFGTSYYAAMNVSCACGDILNHEEYSWPSISISINVGVGPAGPCVDEVDSTSPGMDTAHHFKQARLDGRNSPGPQVPLHLRGLSVYRRSVLRTTRRSISTSAASYGSSRVPTGLASARALFPPRHSSIGSPIIRICASVNGSPRRPRPQFDPSHLPHQRHARLERTGPLDQKHQAGDHAFRGSRSSAKSDMSLIDDAIDLLVQRRWPMLPSRGAKKGPCVGWKQFQNEVPYENQLHEWTASSGLSGGAWSLGNWRALWWSTSTARSAPCGCPSGVLSRTYKQGREASTFMFSTRAGGCRR